MVLEYPGQRQPAAPLRCLKAENARRSDVIRRRGQIDDERLGEKVRAFLGRLVPAVDEDVCEGRCGVADIGLLGKCVENLSDPAVNHLGFVVFVGLAISTNKLLAGIHRGVISLVIDQQQREVGHESLAVRVGGICYVAPDPFEQSLQHHLVLFYNEQPRTLLG